MLQAFSKSCRAPARLPFFSACRPCSYALLASFGALQEEALTVNPLTFVVLCTVIEPTSTLLLVGVRSIKLMTLERKPETDARNSQLDSSRRGIPLSVPLLFVRGVWGS